MKKIVVVALCVIVTSCARGPIYSEKGLDGKKGSWKKNLLYQDLVKIIRTGQPVGVSSWLSNSQMQYPREYLVDEDLKTAWATEKGGGINEQIFLATKGANEPEYESEFGQITNLFIANGYQKSEEIFKENNRIKKIGIKIFCIVSTGIQAPPFVTFKLLPETLCRQDIELKDLMGYQRISLSVNREDFFRYRKNFPSYASGIHLVALITIKEVYKGTKYNDTCISEIRFGRP